jgi:hypothetical protein
MVAHVDGMVAAARSAPAAFVLPEGLCALNGGRVDPLLLIDAVGVPVAADGAARRSARRRALLGDVILNERICRPSVDAEEFIGTADGAAIVADGSGTAA